MIRESADIPARCGTRTAPRRGRRRRMHRLPGYHARISSIAGQAAVAWPDMPLAAGRTWVPGCRAADLQVVRSTFVRGKSAASKTGGVIEFVILIRRRLLILPATGRTAPGGPAAAQAPPGAMARRAPAGADRQICCNSLTRVPVCGCPAPFLWLSFLKAEPAYPPGPAPCGAPRSPPRRGAPPFCRARKRRYSGEHRIQGRRTAAGRAARRPPAWTAGNCRCRTWGTGRRTGSRTRRGSCLSRPWSR